MDAAPPGAAARRVLASFESDPLQQRLSGRGARKHQVPGRRRAVSGPRRPGRGGGPLRPAGQPDGGERQRQPLRPDRAAGSPEAFPRALSHGGSSAPRRAPRRGRLSGLPGLDSPVTPVDRGNGRPAGAGGRSGPAQARTPRSGPRQADRGRGGRPDRAGRGAGGAGATERPAFRLGAERDLGYE